MGNPVIAFRLSIYHLARGLQIIRNLEPDYKITSINKIVKVIYHDYLAKMSLGKAEKVPQHFIDEIESFLYKPEGGNKTLKDFSKNVEVISDEPEESVKSSVEDFSPPKDWDL